MSRNIREMPLKEENFSRRYIDDDIQEQPLMPMYKEYGDRLRTFQEWKYNEEHKETTELLSKAGYYFITGEHVNNLNGIVYSDVACFSCGSSLFVSKDPALPYPHFPFHHLDCQFVKCPSDLMESLTLPPLKTYTKDKKCTECGIKYVNVLYFPCKHLEKCIGCAKKSAYCPKGHKYEGLVRIF